MPLHDRLGRLAARGANLFYRVELAGERPPATGPLLVVANHPNSLLDPALVTLAIGRSARFLAKAPLFTDASVGWLVRASGAIPVHRRQDASTDGAEQARQGLNDDTFRAAEQALLAGDAIALFPEGISHAQPGLAPLKTGAARLALQTAARLGGAFPLVPVGITLDDRAIFRSSGLLVVGAPVAWDDLARDAVADAQAGGSASAVPRVRELTARIEAGIDAVTVSFASWDDARLVALADQIHAAAVATDPDRPGPDVLARRRLGAAILERHPDRDALVALGTDLRRHDRLLRTLRLRPADLALPTDTGTAARWAMRRVHLVALGALAAVGTVLGWAPYRLTGRVAALFPGADAVDVRGTSKALVGGAAFVVWTILLAVVAGLLVRWWLALVVLVCVPPLLLLALFTTEGWTDAWRDARRFLTLRSHAERVAELRARQAQLAGRIEAVVDSVPVAR